MISLRVARTEDAESILAIYSPYVAESSVSFEYEVTEEPVFVRRMETTLTMFPWLVAEKEGQIVGYAYATKHRERDAYQWCAESSVYIHNDFHGKGIAKALYEALIEILTAQNIVNLYAGITQPNEVSTLFHVKMGFTPVGVYKKVGYKNGQWHDVVWLHRTVLKHPQNPAPVIAFTNAEIAAKATEILATKTAILNSAKAESE